MGLGINPAKLGRKLQEQLGLNLVAREQLIDGGVFTTLRPSDLEEGNGFLIVVGRTARRVEASFKADNFAAGLLKKMSQADALSRGTFQAVLDEVKKDSDFVYLEIDGASHEMLPQTSDDWKALGLDVGIRLKPGKLTEDDLIEGALKAASGCMTLVLSLLPIEQIFDAELYGIEGLPEGARLKVEVNRYERNPVNRAACIAHHGAICKSCGFDFKAFYGEIGDGYIEVHHKVPVSKMGEGYFVNPIRDLVPVCANCHAMLHRSDPPLEVESLSKMLESQKRQQTESNLN